MTQHEEAALRKLDAAFRTVSLNPKDAVPDVLYHYTSARGLAGIVASRRLRAGNFGYLNDSMELRYGGNLIEQIVSERLQGEPNVQVKKVLGVVHRVIELIGKELEFYLACFCTESDLLGQWRGYGSSKGRYCIGFETERLYLAKPKSTLTRVLYDGERQKSSVAKDISRAVDMIAEIASDGDPSDDFAKRVSGVLAEKLVRDLCSFKHPGFHEEREWRMVHRLEDLLAVEFEPVGGVIKPFIELSWESEIPIREVIVGCGSPSHAFRAVELLLMRNGFDQVTS